jgi:hypothetical protein
MISETEDDVNKSNVKGREEGILYVLRKNKLQ